MAQKKKNVSAIRFYIYKKKRFAIIKLSNLWRFFMKNSKRWIAVLPATLLIVAMSSCALAKGTYYSEKKVANGIALQEGVSTGYFIYKLNTNKQDRFFNRISITFTNSRISYPFGQYPIHLKATLSPNSSFDGEVISIEEEIAVSYSNPSLTLNFANQSDQIKALKANELYLKIEAISNEQDNTFDPSWLVLGDMNVSGGEQLNNGEEDKEISYLLIDYKTDAYQDALEHIGVKTTETGVSPISFLDSSYLTYKVSPKDEENTIQSLNLHISDSVLKSYEKETEEGKETIQTKLEVYVATSLDNFSAQPSLTYTPTTRGETETNLDLTSAVEKITYPDLYIRLRFTADADIENPEEYLSLGKIEFTGEEGNKVDSYLQKDLKEGIQDAFASNGFALYQENGKQYRLVLKDKGKCEYTTLVYDENGNAQEQKSTVCTWTEKGITYSNNLVAGLDENGLRNVRATYGANIYEGDEHLYEGKTVINRKNVYIYIDEVYDGYYEMIYDTTEAMEDGASSDANFEKSLKNEALRFSGTIFYDFQMTGGGNVVFVNYDGHREIYVHEGKTLTRVSDQENFKRK